MGKQVITILAIVALLLPLLSGCDVLNERVRLRMEKARAERDEARARADEARWRADEAHWRAEETKYEWDGRTAFVMGTSMAMQPLVIEFLGFLIIVYLLRLIGPAIFGRIAYPERKEDRDDPAG